MAVPPDFAGIPPIGVVNRLLSGDWPFWLRRDPKTSSWQVCYQGMRDAVAPIVVAAFPGWADAQKKMLSENAEALKEMLR